MGEADIKAILEKAKVIAVVGLSGDSTKDSYRIAAYLQQHGYRIVPVNPFVEEVLGEKSYKSLLEVPVEVQKTIDVVDVFRKSQDVPPIVEQAIELKQRFGRLLAVWLQKGIINEEAALRARMAGLLVVMDRCLMVEHRNHA
jgi:predicted CoA-binding protein